MKIPEHIRTTNVIIDEAKFLAECIIIVIFEGFKQPMLAVTKIVDFDKKKAWQYQEISLTQYILSSVKNTYFRNEIESKLSYFEKQIDCILNFKITNFDNEKILDKLPTDLEKLVYRLYLTTYLIRFAKKYNFYQDCYLDYIIYYATIFQHFKNYILNYVNMNNEKIILSFIKSFAYKEAKEIVKNFNSTTSMPEFFKLYINQQKKTNYEN